MSQSKELSVQISNPKTSIDQRNSKQSDDKLKISSPRPSKKLDDFDANGVTLTEDSFAQYYDRNGELHDVKRFTWKNKNKIQVEVINYGARVVSIRLPDRKGEIEDVLLGFDDLAGYLFYDKYYVGAVLGRTSNIVKNASLSINNKRYSVTDNYGKHNFNGGSQGFDKAIWDTYITGKKVIMSHISPHLAEGYPGDLLVRASFELSAKNEFKVCFEAQSTMPTCVDMSHLLYFNLAGHHKGPDEIYRHILTLNCNCFTPQLNKIPTGEILNVIHTQYDFQIPKLLGKVIGIVPKDGFNQNLCVNRGMYQNECFVGRLLHPPSGRMMEIYSNQPGVQLNTGNEFGYGNILSLEDIIASKTIEKKSTEKLDSTLLLFQKVHEQVIDLLKIDEQQNFDEIRKLIWKFYSLKSQVATDSMTKLEEDGLKLSPMQNDYLVRTRQILCENEETDDNCLDLKEALSKILKFVTIDESLTPIKEPSIDTGSLPKSNNSSRKISSQNTSLQKLDEANKDPATPSADKIKKESSSQLKVPLEKESHSMNKIPSYYRSSDQILGKGRALYQMHGGISLQTQNYPNAVNIKNFPNCILNPGEVYKHETVYRFWIRAGNPNKWIKRNLQQTKQKNNKS